MNFFTIVDYIGVFVFAISGALAAREKKMDLFGIFIIAFVTSLGGGTLRDVMIGRTPVFWMIHPMYITMIFAGAFFAIFLRNKIHYLRKSLMLFDTIGIGFYTVLGAQIAQSFGLHPIGVISVATVTACFGGVIRDILCNEIPAIFHKEVYATACVIGAITYLGPQEFGYFSDYIYLIAIAVVIVIRLVAIKYAFHLPKID
ncbi:trimeric intracellular cation channel family protein [Capnocytophaga canimorsus]|nr:trimeric intracellular cation channel family protein [Capnocytophaga canimorsus]WGU67781.1 trimeric intracellular cation channel family protein [Capnocytophaga canimorsus]